MSNRIKRSSTYVPYSSSKGSSKGSSLGSNSNLPPLPLPPSQESVSESLSSDSLIPSTRPSTVFSSYSASTNSTSSLIISTTTTTSTLQLTSTHLNSLRYVGQFSNSFLICTAKINGSTRLIYLDQHAICERKLLNVYTLTQPPITSYPTVYINDYSFSIQISSSIHSKISFPLLNSTLSLRFHSKTTVLKSTEIIIYVSSHPLLRPPLTPSLLQRFLLSPSSLLVYNLRSNSCRDSLMMSSPVDYDTGRRIVEGIKGEKMWYCCAHGRPTCFPGEVVE